MSEIARRVAFRDHLRLCTRSVHSRIFTVTSVIREHFTLVSNFISWYFISLLHSFTSVTQECQLALVACYVLVVPCPRELPAGVDVLWGRTAPFGHHQPPG